MVKYMVVGDSTIPKITSLGNRSSERVRNFSGVLKSSSCGCSCGGIYKWLLLIIFIIFIIFIIYYLYDNNKKLEKIINNKI